MSKANALLLALVTAATLVVRLIGIDRLQPHAPEPDAYMVLQTEILRAGREPDLKQSEKGYYAYPLVLARGLALWPEAHASERASEDEELHAAAGDFLRARWLVALLSVLVVPASWMLARRVVGDRWALFAALLTATSLTSLYFSQQARHHAPHASFALLAVVATLQLRERPTWSRYTVAAGLCALALGMLHSGWFALLPILAAHVLRERDERRAPWNAIALPILAAVVAWFAFYPRLGHALDETADVSEGGHTLYWRDIDFSGLAKGARILWEYDPGLTVVALVGALMVIARLGRARNDASRVPTRTLLVMFAYAVPYALALAAYKETCDRMLLPLVPFLALLGAIAASRASSAINKPLAAVLCVALLAIPSFGVVRYLRISVEPDTAKQCVTWLEHNANRDSERILVAPTLTLPIESDEAGLAAARDDYSSRQKRWLRYQIQHGPLADAWRVTPMPGKLFVGADLDKARARLGKYLEDAGARWIVLDVTKYSRVNPLAGELRDWAARHGELAASFRGQLATDDFEAPLDYQDVPRLFARLAQATAFGPTIEVYRVH